MSVRKIAVTGGDGFIGSAVCSRLRELDVDPVVMDRHRGIDILDDSLEFMLQDCEGIIHLAGVLGTAELFQAPEYAIDVNVKGTARVLRAASVIGLPYVDITMPQVWDNIYQATKLAAVKMANAYHRHFDLPVCHVRAFNVFGPGQHVGSPQKIVPTFAHRAWRGWPIPIWGNGEQKVDLIYVVDVAEILVEALRFGDARTIDAGTGKPLTVNEVAEHVLYMTHHVSKVEYLPMRAGEHGDGAVATGEGWEELGWTPKFEMWQLVNTVESYR